MSSKKRFHKWLVAGMLGCAGPAAAFTPTEVELFCGFPFHASTRIQAAPQVGEAINIFRNSWVQIKANYGFGAREGTQAFYDDFYQGWFNQLPLMVALKDPDLPALTPGLEVLYNLKNNLADCLPAEKRALYESYAASALKHYSTLGFTSPANWRLGPVIPRGSRKVVRLYVVPESQYDGIANTASPCSADGNLDSEWLSFVVINRDTLLAGSDAQAYYVIAHELAHVIQNAQTLVNQEKTSTCDPVPNWIGESTADTLGVQATRKAFGVFEPSIQSGLGLNAHSLRSYRVSLPQPGEPNDANLRNYRASSFWRHIIDRYHAGNPGILARYMASSRKTPGKPDWLEYLDAIITADKKVTPSTPDGKTGGLHLAFPNFLTEYATWGTEKFPKVGEGTWLRTAFGNCETITLSPSGPKGVSTSVSNLEPYSGRCYRIKVTGLQPNQRVSVIPMVDQLQNGLADEIHLGTAYNRSKKAFHCYRNFTVQSGGQVGQAGCLKKPFTVAGAGTRIWLAEADEALPGQSEIEYLWILSWVPVQATDAVLGKKVSIPQLAFALDATTAQTTLPLKAKPKSSIPGGQVSKKTIGQLNMSGGADGAQELIPMEGTETTGLQPDFAKTAFRVQDFGLGQLQSQLQNLTNTDIHTLAVGFADVSFGLQTLGDQSIPQENIESDGDVLFVFPEGGIPYGKIGTYRAHLQGGNNQSSEDPMSTLYISPLDTESKPSLSVRIEVLQFDDLGFQAKISGSFCAVPWPPPVDRPLKSHIDAACQNNTHTVEANLIKPYGFAYRQGNALKTSNTPSTRIYAENLKAFLGNVMPEFLTVPGFNTPPTPPSLNGNAGTSNGSPVSATCPLTCEQIQQLMEFSENAPEGTPPPLDLLQHITSPGCMQVLMDDQTCPITQPGL